MAVLNFTSREFRDQQAHVFDLADKGEKIVILRSKKRAYTLVPVEDDDLTFTKSFEERIGMALQELKQMREGQIEELSKEELVSIEKGLEDIKNGKTYKMQEGESLTDFLKRTEECIK